MQLIPFNQPTNFGAEFETVNKLKETFKLCGDGQFTRENEALLTHLHKNLETLLVSSCTHGLELAALLLNIQPGDEVIMPSYTFVSTANAFVLRGAKIVFVDVDPLTMNMNVDLAIEAITPKTKAIVPVHYAGWSCDMDKLISHLKDCPQKIYIVEDAAQSIGAYYKNRPLGSLGELAAMSFHETKNITSGGEGGAIFINSTEFKDRAHILREKGTNRRAFLNGIVDKYSWVDIGSSFLMSELQAAFLLRQLQATDKINERRVKIWNTYYQELSDLEKKNLIELPKVPSFSKINGHIFYLKLKNEEQRKKFQSSLKEQGIGTTFHYVPLHSSSYGQKHSTYHYKGTDFSTIDSQRLVRLPVFYNLTDEQVSKVISCAFNFFNY